MRVFWRIVLFVGAMTFVVNGVHLLSQANGKCLHVELGFEGHVASTTCFDSAQWSNKAALGITDSGFSGTEAGWLSVGVGVFGLLLLLTPLIRFAFGGARNRSTDDAWITELARLGSQPSRTETTTTDVTDAELRDWLRAPVSAEESAARPRPLRDERRNDTAHSHSQYIASIPLGTEEREAAREALDAGQRLAFNLDTNLNYECPDAVAHAAVVVGTLVALGALSGDGMHLVRDSALAKLAAFAEENGLPGEHLKALMHEGQRDEAVVAASIALRRVASLCGLTMSDELSMQLPLWLCL